MVSIENQKLSGKKLIKRQKLQKEKMYKDLRELRLKLIKQKKNFNEEIEQKKI